MKKKLPEKLPFSASANTKPTEHGQYPGDTQLEMHISNLKLKVKSLRQQEGRLLQKLRRMQEKNQQLTEEVVKAQGRNRASRQMVLNLRKMLEEERKKNEQLQK